MEKVRTLSLGRNLLVLIKKNVVFSVYTEGTNCWTHFSVDNRIQVQDNRSVLGLIELKIEKKTDNIDKSIVQK